MGVAEFEDAEAMIELALKVDVAALSSAERTDAVTVSTRLAAKIAALQAHAVAASEAAGDHTLDDHQSMRVALRHRCRLHGGEAAAVVRLGRALLQMPGTADALGDGAISANHARRLIAASRRPEFAAAEAFLLSKAQKLSFKDWAAAVAYWEQVVDEARQGEDPEPPDPREENRSLQVSTTIDQRGRIDGWLDPEGQQTFSEALRRIESEMFLADWALAKEEYGDATCADRLWRTPPQRRADALVEMARRSATAPADGKRPEPLVIVHVDIDTFERALARLVGDEAPEPLGTERLCELDDGTVITPTQMMELAASGRVCRLVYTSQGEILDYGRAVRLFGGKQRQAIQARDRRCIHEGCEVPARQCEVDHVIEWQDLGRTDHRNGRCRCSFHHRRAKPRAG